MENIFDFSDEAVSEYRKRNKVMMFTVPFITIVFSLMIFKIENMESLKLYMAIISAVAVFIMIEIYIVSRIMTKKIRNTKLYIYDDRFERIGGKKNESVEFSQIKSIKEKRNPKGKLLLIELKIEKKTISMFGFENIEKILEIMKEKTSDSVEIKRKQYKVDWNSPFATIIIMLITVIVIGLIRNYDKNIYELFNGVFMIGFSIFFLIYRPVSKSLGSRFRALEVICGLLILSGSVMGVIGSLL